jgi:hypothetical protein
MCSLKHNIVASDVATSFVNGRRHCMSALYVCKCVR